MKVFNVVANIAAAASLISIGAETGEIAARKSKKSAQTAVAVKDIKDMTGDSMLNKSSEKHNVMKKISRNWDVTPGFHKAGGAITGFAQGVGYSVKNNLPALGFSILTLASKKKITKTIGVIGVGVTTAWDFIKNGTNLFSKKDIIEK